MAVDARNLGLFTIKNYKGKKTQFITVGKAQFLTDSKFVIKKKIRLLRKRVLAYNGCAAANVPPKL